jgi:hypothetical protein
VSETFEQAIEREPLYLQRGKYVRYLQSYLEYFGRDKIKIILFEDIVEAPEQTVRDLFTFLELDSRIELNLERVPKNSAKRSRFVSPAPVMGWLTAWLIQRDQAVLMRKLRNLRLKERVLKVSTVECPPEPMNEHTRQHLRRVFRQDIDKLETLIGRDLTAWK